MLLFVLSLIDIKNIFGCETQRFLINNREKNEDIFNGTIKGTIVSLFGNPSDGVIIHKKNPANL